MVSQYNNQTFEWLGILAGGGTIDTKCAICDSRLSLYEPPNNNGVEAFTVLPCGHAFGYECVKFWFQTDDMAKCPTCGVSAKHSGCGHLAKLRKMQQEDKNLNLKMPDNEPLPSRCDYCVYHNLGRSSK
ncbi:hypothetical protein F4801DRAFT_593716 [Xylaria longipes]|nr:hypothetical protein F4801DRAFT_593716 [Xylaria longipes]